jgi:VanZ family protein
VSSRFTSLHALRFYKIIFRYGPLILGLIIGIIGGTTLGRYENSWRLIRGTLDLLGAELSAPMADPQLASMYQINLVFRRLSHVFVYMVLTLTLFRAFQFGRATVRPGAILFSMIIAFLFTFVEAFVRLHSEARHFNWDHFLINGVGIVIAIVGVLIFFGVKWLERKIDEKIAEQNITLLNVVHEAIEKGDGTAQKESN